MKWLTVFKIILFATLLGACSKEALRSTPPSAVGPAPKARPEMSDMESRLEGAWKLETELTEAEIVGGVPDKIRFSIKDDASREMEYCDLGAMKGKTVFIIENDRHLNFQIFVPVEGVGTMPRFFSVEILAAEKNSLRIQGNGRVYEYSRLSGPVLSPVSDGLSSFCKTGDDHETTAAL